MALSRPPCPPVHRWRDAARISTVVIFFEVLLAIASVAILWFALYTVYRLVTDES